MTPIRDIPSHWESGNIRRFAQMKSGHTPSRSVQDFWENTDIPWFTLADVWQLRDGKQIYLGDTANKINELGLANSAAELLPAGTVVLSRTASVGFSGIMPRPMATSEVFSVTACVLELREYERRFGDGTD
ncbi:restriction endonuclease subunit S, partial [Rhodococcus ruber]